MAHAVADGRSRNTLIALLLLDLDHFKGSTTPSVRGSAIVSCSKWRGA
jgi:hypothetical protein